MNPLPAYILAGGKSRRFGSDKARAELNGQPLITRIATAIAPVTTSVTVVADVAGKYADLGLLTIVDRMDGLGPVGGLLTALEDVQTRPQAKWFALLSCDLVELPRDWPASLIRHITPTTQVAAYKSERWEPLLALYSTSIHAQVARYIDEGNRAMWQLLKRLNTAAVPLHPEGGRIMQINTPQDHHAAQQRR